MKHALVVGCSGIVGLPLSKLLLLDSTWKVSGIARHDFELRPKELELLACDVLDVECLRKVLSHEKVGSVTHLFVTSWVGNPDPKEEVEVNRKLLENVLQIVSERCPKLQYVYLQTGTKYYGIHLGESKGMTNPAKEDSPRLKEPIFHYAQEDLLAKMAKDNNWRFVINRPPMILGTGLRISMNFPQTLAIYATIMKELGEPLIFPYGAKSYHSVKDYCNTKILTHAIVWEVEHPHCNGEAFNVTNGDFLQAKQLWNHVGKYFKIPTKMVDKPFRLVDFMKDKGDVWKKIVEKYHLLNTTLEDVATFDFMDNLFAADWDAICITSKLRAFGFTETLDSLQGFSDVFDSLQNLRLIPCECLVSSAK